MTAPGDPKWMAAVRGFPPGEQYTADVVELFAREANFAKTDSTVVDAIAALLSTPEWDSAADYLDAIHSLIALVRVAPGGLETDEDQRNYLLALAMGGVER